jgi:hypothetical protein
MAMLIMVRSDFVPIEDQFDENPSEDDPRIRPEFDIARNEQHDCSGFARLRRSRKHVWHRQKELTPMDAHLVEVTIKAHLTEIRNRLDKAAGIGRAADACAGAGFHEKGLEVALDIEQPLYEATMLLNAASLINRIARQR